MTNRLSTVMLAAALAAVLPAVAIAAGGGNEVQCRKGLVFNPQSKKCEKQAELRPDERLLIDGVGLAKAGAYNAAIATLWRIGNWRANPHALNYLGFAHRKAGRLDEAFTYYRLALAADPDFTLARAYLGEGYLAVGRPDLAEAELAEIAARAGADSAEYAELAGQIEAYRAG